MDCRLGKKEGTRNRSERNNTSDVESNNHVTSPLNAFLLLQKKEVRPAESEVEENQKQKQPEVPVQINDE